MGSCAEVFRYYVIWWKCSFHAYKVVDHLHIVKVWAQIIEQSPPYLPNLIAKSLYRLIEKWWLVVHNDYNTRKSTCINISQMRSDTIIKPFWYTDFDYGLFRYADVGSWRIWSVNRGCLLLLDTLISPLVCHGSMNAMYSFFNNEIDNVLLSLLFIR